MLAGFLTQPVPVPSHFMPPLLDSRRLRIAAVRPLAAGNNAANPFELPGRKKYRFSPWPPEDADRWVGMSTERFEWISSHPVSPIPCHEWFCLHDPQGERSLRMRKWLNPTLDDICEHRLKYGGIPAISILLLLDPLSGARRAVQDCLSHPPPDPKEPVAVGKLTARSGIDYVLIDCADRYDLPDGGSSHVAQTVKEIKKLKPEMMVECLVPDSQAYLSAISTLVDSGLEVFAHSIETVKRLQFLVKDKRASYEQSLSFLRHAKFCKDGMVTRSSMMLGLGETDEEVKETLMDLRAVGVDILTIGQFYEFLGDLEIKEFVSPEKFSFWKEYCESIGFQYVDSDCWAQPWDWKHAELLLQNAARGKKQCS